MKVKWMLSFLLIMTLFCTTSRVTFATDTTSTSVYDTIQKQSQQKGKNAPSLSPSSTQKQPLQLKAQPSGGTFFTFLKLMLALGLVLLLIFGTFKFLTKRTRAFQSVGHIRNLGGVSVGANRSVQLVKIGDEVLVVGVGESVSLLKKVEDEVFLETLLIQPEPVPLRPALTKWVEGLREAVSTKNRPSPFKASFKSQLKDVLKERENSLDDIIKEGDRK